MALSPASKRMKTLESVLKRCMQDGPKISITKTFEFGSSDHIVVAGTQDAIKKAVSDPQYGLQSFQQHILEPPVKGACFLASGGPSISVYELPTAVPSRHNLPHRPDWFGKKFTSDEALKLEKRNVKILLCADDAQGAQQLAFSVYRSVVPLYSAKTDKKPTQYSIAMTSTQQLSENVPHVGDGIRAAAALVDMPPNILNAAEYERAVRDLFQAELQQGTVSIDVVVGEALEQRGMGAIWNVGMGAKWDSETTPRLICMKYSPLGNEAPYKTLVGKGIVFDTGGLAIKARDGMCGMKRDMGGSAGLLGGYYAAVKSGVKRNLAMVMCIAENSVASNAFRQDDIITMYSGKSVEINNTDAEGRLVLGDGVAFATTDLNSDVVLDMATLTGAQGIATGQLHGYLVCDDEELERDVVAAGRDSGDMVWAMPYVPENYMEEFKSEVADMKNSVANRSNCQSSCAASFIRSHFNKDYKGKWAHVDMAYPVHVGERATGYGVALVSSLFGVTSLAAAKL